jgi:hypothetical protein
MTGAISRERICPDLRPGSEQENSPEVICTGPELAEMLGFKNERRISQLCEKGMPRIGRGRYPRNRCVQWYSKFMWNSALQDRRFSDMRTVQIKEKARLYRMMILAAQAQKAKGSLLHINTCRRLWSRNLRKIEIELDRLAIDIADDPKLMIDLRLWGRICSRFDRARDALSEFKKSRAILFGTKRVPQVQLPSDLGALE